MERTTGGPESVPEKKDQRWFEKMDGALRMPHLNGDEDYRHSERDKFFSGEIENPVLDYPDVEKRDLEQMEQDLLSLKFDQIDQEPDENIRELYRARINEDLAKTQMYTAVRDKDMEEFQKYSELVYGQPDPEIYSYLLKKEIGTLWRDSRSEDRLLAAAAKEAYDIFTNFRVSKKAETARVPRAEEFKRAAREIHESCGKVIDIPEDLNFSEEAFDSEKIRDEFEKTLSILQERTGSAGWQVVIEKDRQLIAVLPKSKKIKIPEARSLDEKELRQKELHELLTHVLRSMMGEKTSMNLLRMGVAKRELFEEGLATAREQAVEKELRDFSKADRYLAISLAYGLDGTARDFRGVYEIMTKYYQHKLVKSGLGEKDSDSESRQKAWEICVRTFRGTDCKTPGVCWTKDIIYREGNILAWELIRQDPKEIQRYNIGKIGPDELLLVKRLGIEDKTIQEILEQ